MSVEQNARAAAAAEYPNAVAHRGEDRARGIPYANGYIRGFADGQRSQMETRASSVLIILDTLHATGALRHDDYSNLHDMVSNIGVTSLTEREVDAAARALNPEAWRAYDEPWVDERDLIVEHSRQQARAALEAARAAR